MIHTTAVRLATVIALAAGVLGAAAPSITGVTSAADFSAQHIAYLGYISVFGTGLADGTYTSPNANYGMKLGPTEIFICASTIFTVGAGPGSFCAAAQMVFASPGQVNAVLPARSNILGQNAYLVVRVNGVPDTPASAPIGSFFPVSVYASAPSVFLAGADCLTDVSTPTGCGLQSAPPTSTQVERGAITDTGGNLVWSGNRARLGQYYTAWVTGLGATPAGLKGDQGIGTLVPAYGYPRPSGAFLNVTYAGAVSQFPGLYQVNFQIPLNIGEGPLGYGAWPCGNYNWELPLALALGDGPDPIQIPLTIKNGDVPCKP